MWNNGTAVLNGGTYTRSNENGISSTNSGGNSYYVLLNHGSMTIDGATVEQRGNYSSMIENGWQNGNENIGENNSVMTINSGTFSGGLNTVKNDDYEMCIRDRIYTGNRFKIYSLYPEANISVWIVNGKGGKGCSAAVGHSVLNRTSNIDVGSLMLKYGGGGHFRVGTCQFSDDTMEEELPKLLKEITSLNKAV